MRKLFTLLLAVAASVGTIFAWDYEHVQIADLYYNLDATNQTAEVTSQNSSYPKWSTTITTANIPSSVEYNSVTYTVTSIGNDAFHGCSGLTSVTIPNSVTSIGKQAFRDCSSLTSVIIPNSVTSIGTAAFYRCTGLTSVTISNSVTSIGDGAFSGCTGLTSVTIPNSVTSIGNNAFYGCSLTSLVYNAHVFAYMPTSYSGAYTIPDGIESIAGSAFRDCTGLTSVTIPNSVTSIGGSAFSSCTGLTSPVYNAHVFAFMPTSYSGAYTIPDGIESIAGGAFAYCSGLTSVTIPNSVTSIGDRAFVFCSGLTSLNIPDGVTSIGNDAFTQCTGLTSVTIPNSVTSIGESAFFNCTSLTSVTIPNSVTSIGENVFYHCKGINTINVDNDNPNYCSIDGVLFNKAQTTLILYPAGNSRVEYIIPNSVTSIGEFAFGYCLNLKSIEIPNSVTDIGTYAFCGCCGLTSIKLPKSITCIRESVFRMCINLTSVVIPNNVTTIEDDAFLACNNLASVSIPNSITSIGQQAFYACYSLTSILNYSSTPQIINNNVFGGQPIMSPIEAGDTINIYYTELDKSVCTLYVPAESVEAYKAADVWKDFGNILPIEESGEAEVLSIAEAIQIGMALDSMATSAETYTIEGYVINAGTFYAGAKYQNWYMADDQETASSDFQAYRCYPIDGIDTIEVRNGSKVRMTGHLQKYYDRQKALYVVEMTYTPAIILSKPQIDTITVAEALALGAELEDNASTSKQYAIRGYVSSVSQYYEQFGYQNFYIADDPNSTANTNAAGGFYVYRGIPSTGTAVNKGDFVELTCAIRKYVPASGTNIKIENSEFPVSVTVLQAASDPCIIASGTCGAEGDNLTWTLSCDSVLTISGTGRMANYVLTNSKSPAPWYTYRTAIKSVVIEDGVTSIGKNAFSECDMALVMMSGSVSAIADYAFSSCKKIISVDVAIDNQNYCSVDGILFNKNKTTLILYPAAKSDTSYSIPESVTRIGTASFEYCDSLSNIHIPNSVISIGRSAFYGSSTLTYIAIPNSVTSIEEGAFIDCRGLTSVTIGNSVTSIVSSAFSGCTGLTSIINYASTPQTITASVFNNVNKSTCTLYVPAESLAAYQAADVWKNFGNILPIGDDPAPCIIASGTCGAQGDNLTWMLSCDSVLTISGTGAMADYNLNNPAPWYTYVLSVKTVVVNEGVPSIGYMAFYNCSSLTSITIPNSVKSIGDGAFSGCSSLTSIEIPDSVTSIGVNAFCACYSLASIEIPNSVTSIGFGAFQVCYGLTSVTIPNSVTSIGEYAFGACYSLASIVIPNSVTYIAPGAFARCTSLNSINVANDNTNYISIEGVLFAIKTKTILKQYPAGKRGAYTIPNNVTSIGSRAFEGSSGLTSVIIPNSVTNIGTRAFYGCSSLTSVTNYATTPQQIESDVFGGTSELDFVDKSACTLYVPAQSLAAYQAADVWKEFFNILPIEGELPIEPTEGEFNVLYIGHDGDSISSEEVTLHLPVAPVIEGFLFVGWQTVSAMLTEGIIIQAVYQAEEPTSAPAVYTNPANPAQKLIRNGNVYILRDDKVYTVTGQTVK